MGGRGRNRGGDRTHTEGADSRPRHSAGAPTSPWAQGTEKGGNGLEAAEVSPAGGKAARLTGGQRPRKPGAARRALSTPSGPGRPRFSPRDPDILAAAPAGGSHLPLQTEVAPAPPSHIGRGHAARSPPRPPDHGSDGPPRSPLFAGLTATKWR